MMSGIEVILRLIIAAVLGGMIGIERESAHKPAGLRTHVFVSMGAALFTLIAVAGFPELQDLPTYDPTRMISSILIGVGFIGGGVIMHNDKQIVGLTTAAGLWVASGIGIAVGIGSYTLAIATVILSLITLLGLERIKAQKD